MPSTNKERLAKRMRRAARIVGLVIVVLGLLFGTSEAGWKQIPARLWKRVGASK